MIGNDGSPSPNQVTRSFAGAKMVAVVSNPNEIHKLTSGIKSKQNIDINKVKFICLNTHVYQELARRGLDCKMPADYGLSSTEIEEDALKWFRTFPNAPVRDNKNIKEILQHEGISVWWLVDETIYLSQFVFNTSAKEILRQTIMFDHIISAENPSMVWCTRRNKLTYHIINSISHSRSITILTSPPSFDIKGCLSQRLKGIVHVYGQWAVVLVRKFWWTLLGGNPSTTPTPSGKRILISTGDNWWNIYNLKTGVTRKGQKTFDPVIDILKEDGHTVVLVDSPTISATRWRIGTMKEKKLDNRMIYRPFESYLSPRAVLTAFKAARRIHKDYQSLSNLRTFKESMNWHDIPLWNLVKKNFSFAFSISNLMRVICICEMAKHMVETEKPDGIIMSGEYPSERPMVATARPKGIPTLFFQHGIYSPYHIHYNHREEDISPNGECSAPYCPIPDKFAFYSDYDKGNLVNRGKFPEKDVLVIGQPRYDIIARAPQIFSREETFKRLNLDPNKKLIVWTTQTHGLPLQENERNIAAVYNAVKSLNEIQLVIKLHPGENQKAPLYKKNKSYNPVILDREANTFELLYVSDAVLTRHSTTGVEAIMLDKPVIVMNLSGALDLVPYVESGAALGVYNDDQLIPAIKDALYNKEVREKLAEARRKFVYDHAYIQDGQASKRVADLIIQMIEEAKQRRRTFNDS